MVLVVWAATTLMFALFFVIPGDPISLKSGDAVTVEVYRAKDPRPLKDGSIHGNGRSFTLASGKRVFVGTSADDGGPQSSTATGK